MVGADFAANLLRGVRPIDPSIGLGGLAAVGGEGLMLGLWVDEAGNPFTKGFDEQSSADLG